jgi:hypothetical protein
VITSVGVVGAAYAWLATAERNVIIDAVTLTPNADATIAAEVTVRDRRP